MTIGFQTVSMYVFETIIKNNLIEPAKWLPSSNLKYLRKIAHLVRWFTYMTRGYPNISSYVQYMYIYIYITH